LVLRARWREEEGVKFGVWEGRSVGKWCAGKGGEGDATGGGEVEEFARCDDAVDVTDRF
jgi:hypothetical protein